MTPQTDNHLSARNARGSLAVAPPFVLAMVLAAAVPVQARAAESRAFRLLAEPLESALLRFAVQAGVSVGGLPSPGCGGTSRPSAW
jgi:hypothetical protein